VLLKATISRATTGPDIALEAEEKLDARCCSVPVTVNEGVEDGAVQRFRRGSVQGSRALARQGQQCERAA